LKILILVDLSVYQFEFFFRNIPSFGLKLVKLSFFSTFLGDFELSHRCHQILCHVSTLLITLMGWRKKSENFIEETKISSNLIVTFQRENEA